MADNDTTKLLLECNSGVKMAINAFNEVIDEIQSPNLIKIIRESKLDHTKLGNETRELLHSHGEETKDPHPIAKGMSYAMTELKLSVDSRDSKIADIIADGCNMGIKSLNKYLNKYQKADENSINLTKNIIAAEEGLYKELYPFM